MLAEKTKKLIIGKSRRWIREKSIKRVKRRLALARKRVNDFSEDELEALVAEEEKAFLAQLSNMSLAAVLVALGLS